MHLGVEYWLEQLRLPQYLPLFSQYRDVQELLYLDETALRDEIGIRNGAHRATIVGSLALLRSKYNKRMVQQGMSKQGVLFSPSRSLPVDSLMFHGVRLRSSAEFAQPSAHINRPPHSQFSASVIDLRRMPDIDQGADLTEAESLRRQLEWELSLDENRLESHAWYHGAIPRSHAESLLKNEGDFLIRDASSCQGDLVLSTFWREAHLHFIIAKVTIQPNTVYASIQYRLEDDPFDTVPDLVRYYVGSGKALTVASGAKITTPVNRSQPLSLYSSRYAGSGIYQVQMSCSSTYQNAYSGSATLGRTRMIHPTSREYLTNSLPRLNKGGLRRHPSEPALDERPASPPPKPSRIPSIRRPDMMRAEENTLVKSSHNNENSLLETDEALAEANDIVPQLPVQATTIPRLHKPKRSRPLSDTRNSFLDGSDSEVDAHQSLYENTGIPDVHNLRLLEESWNERFPSLFDPANFETPLLPTPENKPLEMEVLSTISELFESHTPKSMALHLLHNDLDIFGGLPDPIPENIQFFYLNYFRSRGISSGLDLCTLPNGKQYRNDLLERAHSMRLFIALTVLTCPTIEDRCAMLNMWIEVAIESKTALGNMFGYLNIMSGLTMPQIQRLLATWNLLRQQHTSNAYTFEARLRPHKKSEVIPHPPNTTVPDLLSAVLLWEASLESLFKEDGLSLPRLNLNMVNTGSDFGLDCFSSHLTLERSWSLNLPLYMRNSRQALEKCQFHESLLQVFRTEFQMKLLWGSRGVATATDLRYDKFEQVLHALSKRCEQSAD